MALCRCLEEHGWPNGRNGNVYMGYKEPIGYPGKTSSICGHCNRDGVIWLNKQEMGMYAKGERIFELTGGHKHTKIKLK